MASEDRTPPNPVESAAAIIEALKREPEKFNYFFALRCIECANPDKSRLGDSLRPSTDPVRLTQEPSLTFAPSTLSSFEQTGKDRSPRLANLFFGLFGPNGPLPIHLTEYARDRLRNSKDPTFSRFLDIFHHRMLSHFYRAWANKEPTVNFDRMESDRFAKYAGALFGLGMPSLRGRDELPDRAKLYFAGRFSNQARNAQGLEDILSAYFRIPVAIKEFIGQWVTLPKMSQWRLGETAETGSLGQTTLLGEKVWGCQHKFRLRIGPLDFRNFQQLLPGSASLRRVTATVKNYVGYELAWDVNLLLKKEEVPQLQLGGSGQLGWTTWLHSRSLSRDRDETILNVQ